MIPRIKSLKQLIITSFALVLIPLVILLWHSNSILGDMAKSAMSEPVYAVSVARNMHELERLALDIERVTRQYQVLRNQNVEDLARNYLRRYQVALSQLCETSPVDPCADNGDRLEGVVTAFIGDEKALTLALSVLRKSLDRLKQAVSSALDDRLSYQKAHIEQVQARQVWFTLGLISVSLLLALYGSAKILSPVNKLELLIKQLADKKHHLSAVSLSGPSELIQLEHMLHQLARRLNQLENVRQAMLRHAAHELKTPLASIKEGCSLLSEQVLGGLNKQQNEVVTLLNISSLRLENLVSQLLDYNMLLQQAIPERQPVQCRPILADFMKDNQLAIAQNGHRLDVNVELDTLHADAILLRRILDNLLSNAIAYGDRQSTITLRIYLHNDLQMIEMANSGKAISSDASTELFKPFHRGQENRQDRVSGSGLGLSIVSECAVLLSGYARFVDVNYADVCIQVGIPLNGESR